jgi:hypothetical protein
MLLYAYLTLHEYGLHMPLVTLYENGTHELLKYVDINQAIEYP